MLLPYFLGAIPTILLLRRDVRRELGVRWVPLAVGWEWVRREAALNLAALVTVVAWPVVLLKRRAVVLWLAERPWLVVPERCDVEHQ